MFDKIKEKSKKIKASADQKLKNTKPLLENASDSLKEKTGTLGNKATSLLGDGLAEINKLRPLLEESGFIIGDVYFGISFPPKIGIIIEQKIGGIENLDNISDHVNLSKLQSAVLSGIKKVYEMNEVVENHDHTIGQIEIEIGLAPAIKVHLNSNKSRAFSASVSLNEETSSPQDEK